MAVSHHNTEGLARGARMLRTALGPAIARFLEDASGVEVMLNSDGRIWIDRLSEGLSDTGERLPPADGERIVRLVARHVGAEVHASALACPGRTRSASAPKSASGWAKQHAQKAPRPKFSRRD
jgi:type IV secretion system protein TrbB